MEEARAREVKNELLSYDDSMEFANFVKKNLHFAKNTTTPNRILIHKQIRKPY